VVGATSSEGALLFTPVLHVRPQPSNTYAAVIYTLTSDDYYYRSQRNGANDDTWSIIIFIQRREKLSRCGPTWRQTSLMCKCWRYIAPMSTTASPRYSVTTTPSCFSQILV